MDTPWLAARKFIEYLFSIDTPAYVMMQNPDLLARHLHPRNVVIVLASASFSQSFASSF
jgi:hypothetical protein